MAKKKAPPKPAYKDPNTRDLEVGDLCTGYHKGYHRITRVGRRYSTGTVYDQAYGPRGTEYSALIHMRLVMDTKFKEPKKPRKEVACDASYCQKIDDAWIARQKKEARALLRASLVGFSRLNEMRAV